MSIDRRQLLIGGSTILMAASFPAIAVPTTAEPLIRGIRFQSWPFGAAMRGSDWFEGSTSSANDELRPLSHWMKHIERYRTGGFDIYWEPLEPRR